MNDTNAEPPKEPAIETPVPEMEPHHEPSILPEKEPFVKKTSINKRAVRFIALLFIIGAVTGLILSTIFIDETNGIIDQLNIQFQEPFQIQQPHLTTDQIILPTFGVIIVCISVLLLIGMIAVYIKIGLKTKSPYVVGLLIFLIPLLVQTIFSVSALRSLFLSAAIPDAYIRIRESIGFGFGGFGGVLVVISVFEIIGLTMLLYLSQE
jgi:hypothetical protein